MLIFYTLKTMVGGKTKTINIAAISWLDDTTVKLRDGDTFMLAEGECRHIIAMANEQFQAQRAPTIRVTE